MRSFLAAFILFFSFSAQAKFEVDRSHEIFLPPGLKKSLGNYQNFRVFWWNFVILETPDFENQLPSLERICAGLKNQTYFAHVECSQNLKDYAPYLKDWVSDIPIHSTQIDQRALRKTLDKAIAEASLPIGSELIQLLRMDPMESWHELRDKALQRMELNVERRKGFLFEPKSQRVLIPVQMNFPPQETISTRPAKENLEKIISGEKLSYSLIGPHWSTLNNEKQITKDVSLVSWVGTTILVLFILFLIICKRSRAILTIPPVFIAMFASAGITILVFGSIHGLTLAFGTAIVGLAIDYGLHGAFAKHHDKTWKSNAVGMFTTLAGLLIMMTSSIPLIRQLMFFSCIGLVLGFACLYFISVAWPNLIRAESFNYLPKSNKIKTFVILVLVGVSALSPFLLKPNFDMRGFDFQNDQTKKVTQWLFQELKIKSPLFEIHPENEVLEKVIAEHEWALANKVQFESLANYVPSKETQDQNFATWSHCPRNSFSAEYQQFFAPFFDLICRERNPSLTRSYNAHLTDGSSWITLWFPDKDQQKLLENKFPNATSIAGLVSTFPATLLRELRYMIPLSILLVTIMLYLYYRRAILTAFALIPFLSGVGLITLIHVFFHVDISFITLIGLVMVFGFSIDYGIFVTDAAIVDKTATDVWTAISFAALTNLAGFAPLLVCEHPVLKHLGQALFFGTLGTYIGAIWGITGLEKYAKKTA